jgi:hypothetical protein
MSSARAREPDTPTGDGSAANMRAKPYVGNRCVDDNVAECVQVAIWKAIGEASQKVIVRVDKDTVQLGGSVDTEAQRHAAEVAAYSIASINMVVNQLEVSVASARDATFVPTGPLLMATRYCTLDASSIAAAVSQAQGALTQFVSAVGAPSPARFLIVYRNLRSTTVTIDVACEVTPTVAARASGEIHAGQFRGLAQASRLPAGRADDVLARLHKLVGDVPPAIYWQATLPETSGASAPSA